MLRTTTGRIGRQSQTLGATRRRAFSRCATVASQGPNAPLDLDPSFQTLLKDAEMSLLSFKPGSGSTPPAAAPRELEVMTTEDNSNMSSFEDEDLEPARERKSTRARFGTNKIGSVVLPSELQNAVQRVIDAQDKPRLHEDAKRLFRDADGITWHTSYDVKYRSRQQTEKHATRDGTALATVVLPAHFSVIVAVLRELKHRLGPEWEVQRVFDWGAGVGSGLWASLATFQSTSSEPGDADEQSDQLLAGSTISAYRGFEKREGLSSMARRVLEGVKTRSIDLRWNRGLASSEFAEPDANTLALSAFYLSSLPSAAERREVLNQMWNSGANVIVLIDHDTVSGFSSIAEARNSLLRKGREDSEASSGEGRERHERGCHVVAPCPHDQACPLVDVEGSKLKCSFSQRFQRPGFLRKTKHAGAGHEDLGYSYVVIRRGQRPVMSRSLNADSNTRELVTDGIEGGIRFEAYQWPRMVFPPLKRSGHVVIDGCTADGYIKRMTIPKSQGKQAYYDARKSSWGDIFPHAPKNPPQVRVEAIVRDSASLQSPGSVIGKRPTKRTEQYASYKKIMSDLKERNHQKRVRSVNGD